MNVSERLHCICVSHSPLWTADTDILHLDLPGCHLIVLSDSDAAVDLMERRSAAYSDRVRKHFGILSTSGVITFLCRQPQSPMLSELYSCHVLPFQSRKLKICSRMGLSGWTFSMMPYGSIWRMHRRLFHRFFNVAVADLFDDKIEKAVNVFAHRLFESPERFLDHTRLYVTPSSTLLLFWTYPTRFPGKPDWIFGPVRCIWVEHRVREQ